MNHDGRTPLREAMYLWRWRIVAVTGGAALLVAVLAWTFRAQPVAADFGAATRGDLAVAVEDEGETRIHDVYVVSAPVAGRVERIELEVGDPVIAGETLLALFEPADPALYDVRARSEAEAGMRTAEADAAKARAELAFAQSELRRAAELNKKGVISRATLDHAQLLVTAAQAAVNQAAAMVLKRQADLRTAHSAGTPQHRGAANYVPVRSPVSGRVLKRNQQSEAVLAAGTPILEVGDPTKLEIVTDLLSADAVKVHEGDRVIVEEWGGARPLDAKVQRIEPFGFTKVSALGIEEQRVNVVMGFVSPPESWRALGHGYRVVTRIIISDHPNALKVPVSALFRTGADWSVFVESGGRAHLRKVGVGEHNNLEAEVTGGLSEGERIILHPSDKIADGVRVEARE